MRSDALTDPFVKSPCDELIKIAMYISIPKMMQTRVVMEVSQTVTVEEKIT